MTTIAGNFKRSEFQSFTNCHSESARPLSGVHEGQKRV
jgi:hypothetical protein